MVARNSSGEARSDPGSAVVSARRGAADVPASPRPTPTVRRAATSSAATAAEVISPVTGERAIRRQSSNGPVVSSSSDARTNSRTAQARERKTWRARSRSADGTTTVASTSPSPDRTANSSAPAVAAAPSKCGRTATATRSV